MALTTPFDVAALLDELVALERVRTVITAAARDDAWRAVLTAIDYRLQVLGAVLRIVDPSVVVRDRADDRSATVLETERSPTIH